MRFCYAMIGLTYGLMAQAPQPEGDAIRAILLDRVTAKKDVGLIVGVVDANNQRQIVGVGRSRKDEPQAPASDTLFEIGSITKVFTSLVLADMIERGEVKPDDPVEKYLPDGVKVPSRNGKQITLLDISLQSSGLPRLPDNFHITDLANPYADYDAPRLYDFLAHYSLPRDPGEKYEYSNLAVGLLGHALARRAGMSYEEMVKRRVLIPLEMTNTSITLSASQRQRLAQGHNAVLNPVKNWDLGVLEGAGALRSTANDMLKFIAAAAGITENPLAPAFRRMLSVRKDTGIPDLQVAMAWHILSKNGPQIVWHNGGTGGYRSFTGYNVATKEAVVVLGNTAVENDSIGLHVLDGKYPIGPEH